VRSGDYSANNSPACVDALKWLQSFGLASNFMYDFIAIDELAVGLVVSQILIAYIICGVCILARDWKRLFSLLLLNTAYLNTINLLYVAII
jgi:hypothetical protein